jgi:hypothetical protein
VQEELKAREAQQSSTELALQLMFSKLSKMEGMVAGAATPHPHLPACPR